MSQGGGAAAEGKGGKKKKGLNKLAKAPQVLEPEPSVEQLELEVKQALHRGMFRLVAALERDLLYSVPDLLSVLLRFVCVCVCVCVCYV